MKFDKARDKGERSLDPECYRKFLAGNKTLFSKAFWENGPRRGSAERVKPTLAQSEESVDPLSN